MALLEIHDIVKHFGNFGAVDHVSLTVEAGEFMTLLGPSGCGKTTLLRILAGLETSDQGRIVLEGRDMAGIAPENRPIHTVFQNYALFPHMNVAQNIGFPLEMQSRPAREIASRVGQALREVRLEGHEDSYPHEMSGGQRQRVAVARALIDRPRLLLLDEPLSALDAKLRKQMQIELISLQKETGVTFVYVTHDQSEALALSHRIAVMNQGHIEQLDSPEIIYSFPQNRFVADFIGQCNLLDATVCVCQDEHMTLAVEGLGKIEARHNGGIQAGDKGTLALRPEKIRIEAATASTTPEPSICCGKVRDCLYLGEVTLYIVELPEGLALKAMRPNSSPGKARFFEEGDSVMLSWNGDAGHFLPGELKP